MCETSCKQGDFAHFSLFREEQGRAGIGRRNQLLNYAEQDEMWATAVKNEVADRDKAIQNGTYAGKTDWLIEEFQIMQTSGTVIPMPFGLCIITFPSKRQLFRGEIQNFHRSVPSLNRI